MQTNETQTKMTNPPVKETKMVKCKVVLPIRIDVPGDKSDGTVHLPGTIVDLTEEQAAEFCDKKFQGPMAFSGERSAKSAERHIHVRAVRVK